MTRGRKKNRPIIMGEHWRMTSLGVKTTARTQPNIFSGIPSLLAPSVSTMSLAPSTFPGPLATHGGTQPHVSSATPRPFTPSASTRHSTSIASSRPPTLSTSIPQPHAQQAPFASTMLAAPAATQGPLTPSSSPRLPPPATIFTSTNCSHPIAYWSSKTAQLNAHLAKLPEVEQDSFERRNAIFNEVEASSSSVTSPFRTDIEELIANRIATIWEEWHDQIRAEILGEVRAEIQAEVRAQIKAEVRAQIRAEVFAQVDAEMKGKMDLLRDELRAEIRKFRTPVVGGGDQPPTQATY